MKKTITRLLNIILISALMTPVFAQEGGLEETLKEMLSENAKGYLGPLVTAFGTGANSGTYHRAKPHKILGFDFSINVTGIAIPDDAMEFPFFISDNTFTQNIEFDPGTGTVSIPIELAFSDLYEPDQMVPTFFGSDVASESVIAADRAGARAAIITQVLDGLPAGVTLSPAQLETFAGSEIDAAVANINDIQGPTGVDLSAWPSLMPQFAIGLPMNTELMFRGFSTENADGDEISFGGYGLKIGINQFIPTIPLVFPALSVGYYQTNLNLADVVKINNSIFTIQASKSVPMLTVYGGLGFESSTMTVEYTPDASAGIGTDPIKFDIDGTNGTRLTVGFRLKLLLLQFYGDYNMGEYNATNIGIGLTLR